MNILGHAYVATEAVKGNRQLLILGSLLPESFPFVSGNPFGWEEIHEGGEVFLQFLKKKYFENQDLALGMMTHSAKFGADGWDKEIEKYVDAKKKKILEGISVASGVNLKIAELRLHNFLWWGMDVWILRNYPDFVNEIISAIKDVKMEEISGLLAGCFNKNHSESKRTVEFLLKNVYQPQDLNTIGGLARIWRRQAAGLPEKDKVNPQKATALFEEIYLMFQNQWSKIMEEAIEMVKKNLKPFVLT